MAVRDGILAILSLGSGYGLALRDEIAARAPHRSDLNVGQVYSTLERLRRDGLVATGTTTDDNLPLYSLTPAGKEAVAAWLERPSDADPRAWTDFLDQVLLGSSIPGTDWSALLDRHLSNWQAARAEADAAPASDRIASARRHWASAALAWLDDTRAVFTETDPALPLRSIRPSRGRRPGQTGLSTP
ncbi:PadR family transcriptional regulator [Mycetocola manganoxydans]|uniref:PadR family transcriptional regulator n=1 Tax=Mycetocola manganoxydans TaxID=699879 RepID=A0A3L6ZV81_9MICO|nr:PadR family transcriptional regulator [Mycetocola manganoxydans]RLP71770.1 PadR family transcriptional regulator [Mycetocola manganoxydans]GHD39499.1 hypothetical protein GCM10008097_02250 [Mycetocola manganoxydans]